MAIQLTHLTSFATDMSNSSSIKASIANSYSTVTARSTASCWRIFWNNSTGKYNTITRYLYLFLHMIVCWINELEYSLELCESQCLGFWPSTITHFSANVLAYHDRFQQMMMKPRGWQVGFPHSPTILPISLSSVKPWLSLSDVDGFCTSQNETLLQ